MIVNTGLKRFLATKGGQPSFLTNFMSGGSIAPARGTAPTFTRATIATVTDQDLVVRQVLSGEARFGGFRRVQNLLGYLSGASQAGSSEDITSANWSLVGGASRTATSLTFTASALDAVTRTFINTATGSVNRIFVTRLVVSTSSGTKNFRIRITQAGVLDYYSADLTATTTPRIFSHTATVASAAGTAVVYAIVNDSGASVGTINVNYHQCEEVTGASNQNPAEYVSVGVLAAPYQGANVDGVQYFPYLNGNTVASNVVTEARGAAISSSILGGYLPEPAATEIMLATNVRDMTTAGWTLGATMTRARSSVGADGVANKATRLTGGAVAATNIITSTIVAAASTRTYSVLIKRVTGTGPVRITQDNFATSTDISSLINSSTFTLVQIAQSQLNAVFGIKIDTNADAIDADWNSFIAGDLTGLINSRIPDTISTRNADVLTYATTGWLNASAGTLYAEFFNPTNTGASAISAVLNNGTANNFVRTYRSSTGGTAFADVADGGVTQSNLSVGAVATGAPQKIVSVYQANDFAGFANNTSLGTDVAGTIPALTQLDIGHQNGGALLGHYVRKVSYYPSRLANSVAQSLTV